MWAEIYQGASAAWSDFESGWMGTCIRIFSSCLTVKIKLNEHFALATLGFFYMKKLTPLTFGRSQMASCGFIGQLSFCLNAAKTLKARRNTAILTSLHWNLTGQQSAQLVWLREYLDNHNLRSSKWKRTRNRLLFLVLLLNISVILDKPFSPGVPEPLVNWFWKYCHLMIISFSMIPLHSIST